MIEFLQALTDDSTRIAFWSLMEYLNLDGILIYLIHEAGYVFYWDDVTIAKP